VLVPESGMDEQPPFARPFLAHELKVPQNAHSRSVPLLYSILAMLQGGELQDDTSAAAAAAAVSAGDTEKNV
jgi:hypothetical protein